MRYPGTIKARFLKPIPAGLDKAGFMARLVGETEAVCDELLIDAAKSQKPPPLPPTAVRRLRELGIEA